MAELVLHRVFPEVDATIGDLYVDGRWFCHTLEDVVREDGVKVPGETAIPMGKYRVRITYSPRFKRLLPLLHEVPGFSGVRIHPGNTALDTEGCILVGDRVELAARRLVGSRSAFNRLYAELEKSDEHVLDVIAG